MEDTSIILPKETTETEVRRLRDNIYGHHSDQGWDACKANWMVPENVQWLREHQPKQSPKGTK